MKNDNSVQLLDYAGSDKSHCLSAWQSTTEELGIELPKEILNRVDAIFAYLCQQKKKAPHELLNMLSEAGHHTPFESSYFHFQITADIASHIHALKHRIGVGINAESARYKEFVTDKWYLPLDWANITVSEGSRAKLATNPILAALGEKTGWDWFLMLDEWQRCSFELYHHATDNMRDQLGTKRAKESTRYFLTYATQLHFDFKCNFRSLMHFQGLRNSPHAQKEINGIAKAMLAEVASVGKFALSLKAFNY